MRKLISYFDACQAPLFAGGGTLSLAYNAQMLPALLAVAWIQPDQSPSSPAAREIAFQIEARVMADQEARNVIVEAMKQSKPLSQADLREMARIDRENTAYMKELIARIGWPRSSSVGKQAAHDAWLLVQHADLDPKFQEHCLKLIEPLMGTGEVKKQDYAYLFDRVARAMHRKQRYGTQFIIERGKWVMAPTEDPSRLDARRKKMGMPPMAVYQKKLEEVYGHPKP